MISAVHTCSIYTSLIFVSVQTTSYMNGTGILACANSTSAVYSNFTSYSSNELRVLCTNLCS